MCLQQTAIKGSEYLLYILSKYYQANYISDKPGMLFVARYLPGRHAENDKVTNPKFEHPIARSHYSQFRFYFLVVNVTIPGSELHLPCLSEFF